MSERTWSTWQEALAIASAPEHLRRTLSVALIVGSTFFAMNQFPIVVAGRANAIVWMKAALTYLTPLFVSTFGVLSATRQA